MTRRPFKAFVAKDSQRSLEQIVSALNEATRTGAHSKLLKLVTALIESGPNLQKMCAADPVLNRILRAAIQVGYRPSSSGGASLELMPQIFADPRDYGDWLKQYYHRRDPKEAQAMMRAESEDYLLFLLLTLGDWKHLGGPCGRCGKWYIKRRTDQKTYCSRKCGSAFTAIEKIKEQRERDRKERLELARNAAARWEPTMRLKAKEFIARETGFTVKWLTRAINRGELRFPKGR